MKKIPFILIMFCLSSHIFAHCLEEPKYYNLDNSIDTIVLTGRCGNPLDEEDTKFLDPENFSYFQLDNQFIIVCSFTKNCAGEAYVTVQANDTLINISKYQVDTGIMTTCEDYESFVLFFPVSLKGYFRISANGFDTIVKNLNTINNLELNTIKLYPNPAKDQFIISGWTNGDIAKIYNIQGQEIKSVKINQSDQIIDISDLKVGIYIVKVNNYEKCIQNKLLIFR